MRKILLVLLIALLFAVGLCAFEMFAADGYYYQYTPCTPIKYPDGQKTRDEFDFVTSDSKTDVIKFYETQLNVKKTSLRKDSDEWWVGKDVDSTMVYSCYGAVVNSSTLETGCIFISEDVLGTRIQGMSIRSDASMTCQRRTTK